MGMDMTIHVIRGKEFIEKDFFNGRKREWFDNMRDRGNEEEYDFLPVSYGLPSEVPDEVLADFQKEDCYFDFRYMTVRDYIDWYRKYRPDLNGGWVTSYDRWRIEKKGHVPANPIHYLSQEVIDANGGDLHFVTWEDPFDCARWLYNVLMDCCEIGQDDLIVYYFDN